MKKAARIHVAGIVQGVGFRPFVYNSALKFGLRGFCLNDSEGVVIEVAGESIDEFIREIKENPPELARITHLKVSPIDANEIAAYRGFEIRESIGQKGLSTLISPDVATCGDCIYELLNPSDRRYLYPFINCTNCGPRYSIIKDVPYDRPNTTMAPFRMCLRCGEEYRNALDRRFHAQPNACEECGPRLWLAEKGGIASPAGEINYDAIKRAKTLLKEGAILAIKGIGGFHLACDAENTDAVKRLREKKRRSNKPFALMSPDVTEIRSFAEVSDEEESELRKWIRPIVILKKKNAKALSPRVAPGNACLGVMLPYTPVHHLL
ncbi:MAG: Sua5/YciO/YrdC/YwlC family protein, partial [Deltaproteobacteria bacterium]